MSDGDEAGTPSRIGPFRVLRRLGAGGMAEAFEALRCGPGGFEQRVCVKRVLPAYSTDDDFVRLFLREARLAASLSHRNIARVLELGEDRGSHYLALELVEGMDLRRLLRALPSRALPPHVAALVAMEIAEALDHAHTRSGKTGAVVHRDVSPANILVSESGEVKLTDFGISKALNDSPLTRSELVRGNIWYMAPEQLEGTSRSDPRSDLFALGLVLYESLAGRRPYQGPSDMAAMVALSEGRRTPLGEVAPHVPAPLALITESLLRQDPEERPQHAGAVALALASWVPVSDARRALAVLVREHGAHPRRRRAVVSAPPITLELRVDAPALESSLPIDPRATVIARPCRSSAPSAPSRAAPEPASALLDVPARWRPYALAPNVWASVDRAVAQRRARAPAEEPITLPRSRFYWLALGVAALSLSMLACLLGWALA